LKFRIQTKHSVYSPYFSEHVASYRDHLRDVVPLPRQHSYLCRHWSIDEPRVATLRRLDYPGFESYTVTLKIDSFMTAAANSQKIPVRKDVCCA